MPLSQQLKKTLMAAIRSPEAQKIQSIIVRLAENNLNFARHLETFLKFGGKFIPHKTSHGVRNSAIASYERIPNAILLDEELVSPQFQEPVIAAFLELLLRHEGTHASDFCQVGNQGEVGVRSSLMHYMELANMMFNVIGDILRTKSVNPQGLDGLSKLFHGSSDTLGRLTCMEQGTAEEKFAADMIEQVLTIFPFCVDIGAAPRFITSARTVGRHLITTHTYDVVDAQRMQRKGLSQLAGQQKQAFEQYTAGTFNLDYLPLWDSLSPSQRKTLSYLLTLQLRIVENVNPGLDSDSQCYPVFQTCISDLGRDCLKTLFGCQMAADEPGFALLTTLETHAVLHERTSPEKLTPEMLQGLIEPLPVVARPKRSLNNVAKKPIETRDTALASNAFVGFSVSFTLSFFDVLLEGILTPAKLSKMNVQLAKIILSVVLLFMLGFSMSEIVTFKVLSLFYNIFCGLLNKYQSNIPVLSPSVSDAMLAGYTVYRSDSVVVDAVIPAVGAAGGYFSAKAVVFVSSKIHARFFKPAVMIETPEQLYVDAMECYRRREYDSAIDKFQRALVLYPKNTKERATCHYFLATCYIQKNNPEKAVANATEALSIRQALCKKKQVKKSKVDAAQRKLDEARAISHPGAAAQPS